MYDTELTGNNVQLSLVQGCTSTYNCWNGEVSSSFSITATSQRDCVFYVTSSSGMPESFTLTVDLQ